MSERNARGQFVKGNGGGPGNPLAAHVAALRRALLDAVSPQALKDVVKALLSAAKAGDVGAAKLLLTYTLGRPQEPDLLERLEQLEAAYAGGSEAGT